MLLPGTMEECFEFGWRAFDLAERLQTPVFVLSDLDLGMNLWMTEPFDYPDQPMDRGKVLSAEDLERARRLRAAIADVDGDGIPYRTLPGTEHPLAAYFTRGTGHNEQARIQRAPRRLGGRTWPACATKHETARTLVPKPVVDERRGRRDRHHRLRLDRRADRRGARPAGEPGRRDELPARCAPCRSTTTSRDFVDASITRLYVVENNFDGQMRDDPPDRCARRAPPDFTRVAHCDGLPLTARWIAKAILEQER